MFRRRCVGVAASASPIEGNVPSLLHSCRAVTTRGQFNPIHTFTEQSIAPAKQATNNKEFEVMITNPGPLTVTYSPDYLDWLYRAYNSKVRYAKERQRAEEVFKGMLLTEQPATNDTAAATLPGAPPPGQILRPPHSIRRLAGQARRAAAQEKLDALAQNQGLLDLFERQPQFPAIHIGKASRYHVVELFKEMVLDRVWEPEEVWDKALLYRAILNERKSSYPSTYKYILDSAEAVVLTPRSTPSPAATASSGSHSSQSEAGVVGESATVVPKEEDYLYFLYLVRRYYLDNAVEGHVVLRCHRSRNASELLFSHPPPKDEQEVLKSVYGRENAELAEKTSAEGSAGGEATSRRATQGAFARPQPPSSYPPIEALWRCEENEALLRVLVFGELNLLVSENPFVRFPNAQAYLTRPSAATPASATSAGAGEDVRNPGHQQRDHRRDGRRGAGGGGDGSVPLSSIISEKRGHLLAPLARNVAMMIDARANDVRRLQQRHGREDTAAFQKFLRGAQVEENPGLYSSYTDWSYFNPRAVRAEDRDALSRQAIASLKTYDQASKDIYRVGYEEVESANAERVLEGKDNAPSYVPTLPHFVSLIKKDPYVSFLTYVALPTEYGTSASAAMSDRRQLEKLVVQLGRALHRTALDFHKQSLRRVNHQKVQVAAALLDRFVKDRWHVYCVEQPSTVGVRDMARRFSAFVPFEARIWDESGFPSDARVEDYERWMAPPSV